jgi:hypothetical protein
LSAIGVIISIKLSLSLVALVLVGSVLASLLIAPAGETTIQVDLPPDFDLPLGEELNEAGKQEKDEEKAGKTVP